MRHPAVVAAVTVSSVLLAGCLPEQETAVSRTAEQFEQALAAGDGAAACDLLAPQTRQELESSEDAPCAEAVTGLELPRVDRVSEVRRNGRFGTVLLTGGGGTDRLFLARFGDRWLVDAAGCTPRGDLPYDCDLEGL